VFGDDVAVLRKTEFQLLLLTALLPPLGISMISPVLDAVIEPWNASPANIGLLISFYTAPAIVFIPVMGVLADRYQRKQVLVPSVFLFGLAGTALAFTTDFRVALGLRCLQGIAFSGLFPTLITSIGDLFSGTEEAAAQGFRQSGAGLSGAVFPVLSGAVVLVAWQYSFLFYLIAFPIAALLYVFFDEPIRSDDVASTDGGVERDYFRSLTRLLRRRRVSMVIMALPLSKMIWIGFLTYNSIIVARLLGGSSAQAGIFAGMGSFSLALAASQAGRFTQLSDGRFVPLALGDICLGLGFVLILFAPAIEVAGIGVVVAGVGYGLTQSLYRAVITGMAPQDLRGGLVSFAETSSRLVDTLTPIAMGAILTVTTPMLGFASALQLAGLVVAVFGGLGSLLCLFVAKISPPVPADIHQSTGQ
jgi:MFS family permease